MKTYTDLVHSTCNNGQSVYDVIEELKRAGKIPQSSRLGDAHYHYEPVSDDIVAYITVRRGEMYTVKA